MEALLGPKYLPGPQKYVEKWPVLLYLAVACYFYLLLGFKDYIPTWTPWACGSPRVSVRWPHDNYPPGTVPDRSPGALNQSPKPVYNRILRRHQCMECKYPRGPSV